MAKTSTKTSTKTYARIAVMKANLGLLLVRAGDMEETMKMKYLEEIEKKNIKRITFYGKKTIENIEYRFVELDVKINWDLHDQYILDGEINIELPDTDSFKNGIMPDIIGALEIYLSIIDEYNYKKTYTVYWSDNIYRQNENVRAQLRNKLDLVKSPSCEWYGNTSNSIGEYQPRELKELTATINISDDS